MNIAPVVATIQLSLKDKRPASGRNEMMLRVGLIGPGRAGQALVRLLPQSSYEIGPVLARSFTSARRATRRMKIGEPARNFQDFAGCGLILIAVPDSSLPLVAWRLAQTAIAFRRTVVLHTSALLDSAELAPVRSRGAAVGSLHPLHVFSRHVLTLSGTHFAAEGDAAALRMAQSLVNSWQGRLIRIQTGRKTLYHAATTLASPLFGALLDSVIRLLARSGIAPQTSMAALRPLLQATLENYLYAGRRSWSKPLSENGPAVVRRHIDALARVGPEFAAYYQASLRHALALASLRAGRQIVPQQSRHPLRQMKAS